MGDPELSDNDSEDSDSSDEVSEDEVTEDFEEGAEKPLHRGQALKCPCRSMQDTAQAVGDKFKDMVENMSRHVSSRFASLLTHPVMESFNVFAPSLWPQHEHEPTFGNDKIAAFLAEHFSVPLVKNGFSPDHCVVEWVELKLLVKSYIQGHSKWTRHTLWADILQANEGEVSELQNVLALVQKMLVMLMHTSELERNFSLSARIKTDWREKKREMEGKRVDLGRSFLFREKKPDQQEKRKRQNTNRKTNRESLEKRERLRLRERDG